MSSFFISRKIVIILILSVLLMFQIQGQQQKTVISKPQQQSEVNEIPYTQNIQEFKSKKYNQRLQMVVGCWLLSREYLDLHKSNYLFFKDLRLKEIVTLKLVKECMKKIDRKDAVTKITALVGKNLQPAKNYQDLVNKQKIDDIFIEISQLTIANYHHYEPINKENLNLTSQNSIGQHETETKESFETGEGISQQEIKQTSSKQDSNNSQSSLYDLSEFDTFLIDLIKKYNEEFHKLISSKQGLRGKVEQELKKREKYYFGFIPASSFTHSVFLVTISLSMVFCCTCYKYYKMRKSETEDKKKKMTECNENGHSHSHSHSKQKQTRNVARMTQLTMKRKVK